MKNFALQVSLLLGILFTHSASAQDVLTQHNDLARTGWNSNETTLNTNNVNSSTFGLAFTLTVDDKIYAQPLVVTGVNIPNVGIKNVVYVATVNNTIYAFDADVNGSPYWQVNYSGKPLAGARPITNGDIFPSLCNFSYNDFNGNIGIVGTPVIDKAAGTMYFVTKVAVDPVDNHTPPSAPPYVPSDELSYTSTGFHQFLHAIDITNGNERPNSPVEITATYPGVGDGNNAGIISFDPRRQFNRSGLVLSAGIVYIAFAAHCDFNPSHGWLLGYNASTLAHQITYNATPNDGRGGTWMSGGAPAVDNAGNIYFTTGNGLSDDANFVTYPQNAYHDNYTTLPSDPANRGESVIKLTPNASDNTATALNLSSYFTPYNYQYLNDVDLDFPIQTMPIPGTNLLVTGCKDGNLYVMNQNSLGGYNATTNGVLQTVSVGSQGTMHSSFAYFGGTTPYFYQFSENTSLLAYPIAGNALGTPKTGNVTGPNGASGAYMSVSSNGTDPATGILWIAHAVNGCNANSNPCKGILRAVNASDITKPELWNSAASPTDDVTMFSKMVCPTVANGKVYLPAINNMLAVYGLKTNTTCATNVAVGAAVTASYTSFTSDPTVCCQASYVDDGDMTTRWSSNGSGNNSDYIYLDLGAKYDICKIAITWENAYGKDFDIQISNDGTTWTTIDPVTGNTSKYTEFDGSVTAEYVRMQGITPATGFGYSIYEFQVFGQPASACAAPAELTSTNVTQNTATLNWDPVSGATQYLIQYRPSLVSSWISRTTTSNSEPISNLSCGTTYYYTVQALCGGSAQSTTSTGAFSTSNCLPNSCDLITRYHNADVGDIGVPGSVCLNGSVYTISGSGTDIGGASGSDEFQFVFTQLAGDMDVYGQILQQDQVSSSNKIGVMIKDSVSSTAPFAYLASVNGGNSFVFEYRSVSGGPTTQISLPGQSLPYWVKLSKTGTKYSAFISPDGTTWTMVGGPVDLNFGTDVNNAPAYGMAVTSADNTILSTGQIGSFNIVNESNPLPIILLSFTARNINNDYVSLAWATSMEQNVDHFEVQRSVDANYYQTISTVKGAGNSETLQNYSAQDNQPPQGLIYYRLKEVDLDGKFYYSPVVQVQFGKQTLIPVLFPNPATTYVSVLAGSEPLLEITVYDELGKELKHIYNSTGATAIRINTASFSQGIYFVQINTATKTYRQKLIKQ